MRHASEQPPLLLFPPIQLTKATQNNYAPATQPAIFYCRTTGKLVQVVNSEYMTIVLEAKRAPPNGHLLPH